MNQSEGKKCERRSDSEDFWEKKEKFEKIILKKTKDYLHTHIEDVGEGILEMFSLLREEEAEVQHERSID